MAHHRRRYRFIKKKFRILFPCTYCLRFKALYTFKIDFVLFLRHALPRRLLLLASMHTDTTGYLSLGVSIGPRTQFGFASLRFFRTDRTLRAQPKKKVFSLSLSTPGFSVSSNTIPAFLVLSPAQRHIGSDKGNSSCAAGSFP